MIESIDLMTKGLINPSAMITHIGGMNAVIDTVINLPKLSGGKKLIYNHIDMPLVAISDFEQLGADNPLYARLAEIVKRSNGLWSAEAEKVLLEHYGV